MPDAVTELFSAPLTFNWTLSFRCNFSCSHCYSRDESVDELATADILRIVDILVEKQVLFINFGGGEPLIRDDLFEIADYAVGKGLNVSMNSNGWSMLPSPSVCGPAGSIAWESASTAPNRRGTTISATGPVPSTGPSQPWSTCAKPASAPP